MGWRRGSPWFTIEEAPRITVTLPTMPRYLLNSPIDRNPLPKRSVVGVSLKLQHFVIFFKLFFLLTVHVIFSCLSYFFVFHFAHWSFCTPGTQFWKDECYYKANWEPTSIELCYDRYIRNSCYKNGCFNVSVCCIFCENKIWVAGFQSRWRLWRWMIWKHWDASDASWLVIESGRLILCCWFLEKLP